MCGLGGGYDAPDVPPPPPVQPEAPDASKRETVSKDADEQRRRAAGAGGTILTGARGLQPDSAAGGPKTLLGG